MTPRERAEYEILLRDAFSGKLQQIENNLNRFEQKLQGTGTTIGTVFGGITLANAFNKTIGLIKDATEEVVTLGMEMERTQIKFTALLGQGDQFAKSMIKDFQKFALETPFSTKGVMTAATQLTAYQFQAHELIPTMSRLGDVVAALNLDFGDMAWLYGTTRQEGRLMTRDLNQFQTRGIPLATELAKQFNVPIKKVRELTKQGKISFDNVEKAFVSMTSKGGQFYNVMDAIAKSTSGRWERLRDTLEVSMTSLGMDLLPTLNKMIDTGFNFLEIFTTADWYQVYHPFEQAWSAVKNIWDAVVKITENIRLWDTIGWGLQQSFYNIAHTLNMAAISLEYITGVMANPTSTGPAMTRDELEQGGWLQPGQSVADINLPSFRAVWMKKMSQAFADRLNNYQEDPAAKMARLAMASWAGGGQGVLPATLTGPTWMQVDDKIVKKGGYAKKNVFGGGEDDTYGGGGLDKLTGQTRNVYLNITNLVGSMQFSKSYNESEDDVVKAVTRALVMAANDVNHMTQ